jgi:hypothetical protein
MIRKFLDVSSGHLSRQTWTWLDEQPADEVLRDPSNVTAAGIAGGRTRHGWFVYAPEDPPAGYPADLLVVLAMARIREAEYVLFDCDAVRDQGLPILHHGFAD